MTPLPCSRDTSVPVERSRISSVMSPAGESGWGAVVTVISGWVLSKAMNTGTSPGRPASAMSSMRSSGSSPGASPDEATPGMPTSGSPLVSRSISS